MELQHMIRKFESWVCVESLPRRVYKSNNYLPYTQGCCCALAIIERKKNCLVLVDQI